MMIKKVALLLAACTCLGLISCSRAPKEESTGNDTVQTEETEGASMPTDTFSTTAKIVNKDGAKGVVTYVIDDYFRSEYEFASGMLEKYQNLSFSFAVVTDDIATLKTQTVGDGKLEYVKDENGKYEYTVNEDNVYWLQGILDLGRTEIVSHSHTHAFWGTNDDGGVFNYFKNDGTFMTSAEMPKGSATKELLASKQIIRDLFPSQRGIAFVEPSIGVRTSDASYNGQNVVTFKKYFNDLLSGMIESGEIIGSRGTFQATSGYDKYVNTRLTLASLENKMNVKAFMILDKNSGNGIENWTNYIDEAMNMGGWACFCIHKMTRTPDSVYHYILQSQADQLFGYTDSLGKDVWVAPYTDALLYFSEWSTASVDAKYNNGKITVSITDKEHDEVYNMPLTVKVTVPDGWSEAKVGNEVITVNKENNQSFVYVNVVPDADPVEITQAK